MDFDNNIEGIIVKLLVSLAIGSVIGAEREFRNKSAGLRTLILICIGSTVFTIISFGNSHPAEVGRIASNIVTGIGFLGAGAIMREGLSVSGLTTASIIWIVASLGMAVGVGEFSLSIWATAIVMVVLTLFNYVERLLNTIRKTMKLHFVFDVKDNGIEEFENEMNKARIRFERLRESRKEGNVRYEYELTGRSKKLDQAINYLINQKEKVKEFEY